MPYTFSSDNNIMIMVIVIAPYHTDKGEHTALYKVNKTTTTTKQKYIKSEK